MKKYELPGLILACTALLGYIMGFSLIEGVVMTAFVGATYWSGRREENEKYIEQ